MNDNWDPYIKYLLFLVAIYFLGHIVLYLLKI
jgi:hypothetical protein